VNERLGENVPVVYNPLTEDLEVSSNASTGVEIYFSAPDGYLGDQKYRSVLTLIDTLVQVVGNPVNC